MSSTKNISSNEQELDVPDSDSNEDLSEGYSIVLDEEKEGGKEDDLKKTNLFKNKYSN